MRFAPLFTAVILAGCAPQFPVVGRIDDNTPMQGAVTVNVPSGVGEFEVATADGLTCSGTYDGYDESPTIRVPVTCSDGRSGVVLATRSRDGLGGTATAQLDDGTRAVFVFGDVDPATRAAMLAGGS